MTRYSENWERHGLFPPGYTCALAWKRKSLLEMALDVRIVP